MDRVAAKDLLGVGREASSAEVLRAYALESRRLKRELVEAERIDARDRARRALWNLVQLRDLALGEADAEKLRARREAERRVLVDDWWRPEDGVPAAVPGPAEALSWLGLRGKPARATVRLVLDARARQIKMRIARATTEGDLRSWQQLLLLHRRVASAALAGCGPRDRLPGLEDTMTDEPRAT